MLTLLQDMLVYICFTIIFRHSNATSIQYILLGYVVREINASDDRSLDIFKRVLDDTTQSRTEIFKNGRPNCLIFDEIDGAPGVKRYKRFNLYVGIMTLKE